MSKQLTKLPYTQHSDRNCKVCGKPIKQNLVNRQGRVDLCYICYKVSIGKIKSLQTRKGRSNRTIDYVKRQDIQIHQFKHV